MSAILGIITDNHKPHTFRWLNGADFAPEFLYETTIVNVCTTDKIAVENRSHNLNLRCKSM